MVRPNKQTIATFEISHCVRGDGSLAAAYFKFSNNQVVRTEEQISDTLLIDYDADDRVVGIEILAPVRLEIIVGLVPSFKTAIEKNAPKELLCA